MPNKTVKPGNMYRDNHPDRMGRTLTVLYANAHSGTAIVQSTRGYMTRISVDRLQKDYRFTYVGFDRNWRSAARNRGFEPRTYA